LVAKINDLPPEVLIGWVVVSVTNDGQTLVETNARDRDGLEAFLTSVINYLPTAQSG
jgi:hypothetical protein